jgi:hypothetical protein
VAKTAMNCQEDRYVTDKTEILERKPENRRYLTSARRVPWKMDAVNCFCKIENIFEEANALIQTYDEENH